MKSITNMGLNNNISAFSDEITVSLSELFVYAALIFVYLTSLFYPIYIAIHSFYHIVIFAFALLVFAGVGIIRVSVKKAIALILFTALCAISIVFNHSGLGLLVTILWPISIIYIYKYTSLSRYYINRLNFMMLIGWIFAVLSTLQYDQSFFERFALGDTESINPNTIAIVISFSCLFLEMYLANKTQSWLVKCSKDIVYIVSIYALYRTGSRTSLVAFLLILLLEMLFKKKIKKSKKFGIAIIVAVMAAGIIFPFVYVMLYEKGYISYQTLLLGKRVFTGRQYIWKNLWDYVQNHRSSLVWGVGYNTELYSRGTFNMHNSYLGIFAQYGIPVLVFYLIYVLSSISNMYSSDGQISELQFKCYQILLYMLIVAFGETVLIYLPNLIFFGLAIGIGGREKSGGRFIL